MVPKPPSHRRAGHFLTAALAVLLAPLPPLVARATPRPVESPATTALAALRSDVIQGDAVARRVLYTWTSREQVTKLRQNPVLLTRSESPQYGPSHYDAVMQTRVAAGDPVAQLLRQPDFLRKRFAWTNPWATLRGNDAAGYGDQLVRVTLREESWIAVFSTKDQVFRFVDLHNQTVTQQDVLQTPRRLAAVYFVNDQARGATYETYGGGLKAPYREYVLCNAAMVLSWEAGSRAVHDTLQQAITAIKALHRTAPPPPLSPPRSWALLQQGHWRQTAPPETPLGAYELALAFANARYYPDKEQLAALVKELQKALHDQPAELHGP